MSHESNVKTVRDALAAMHMGALKNGESVVHLLGLFAVQAKRHGSQVWFYLDGKRVSRAHATEHAIESMAQADRIAKRVKAAGIERINTDTDVLRTGFHDGGFVNVGTVGHRDVSPIICTGRELPPGKYDAQLAPTRGKPGSFDVIIVDELHGTGSFSDELCNALERAGKAFGFVSRCMMLDIDRLSSAGRGKLLPREVAQATPPRRNHGPRNRWGKLV